MLEKKKGCNGSACPCTNIEELYVHIYNHMIYIQYKMTQTPSIDNLPLQMIPPGTRFMDPFIEWWIKNKTERFGEQLGTIPTQPPKVYHAVFLSIFRIQRYLYWLITFLKVEKGFSGSLKHFPCTVLDIKISVYFHKTVGFSQVQL